MIPAEKVTRPAGSKPYQGPVEELLQFGEALFKDARLSTNGLSCNSCHANHANYAPTFAQPYPHYVKMADEQGGIKSVHLDEMVQPCLLSPMAGQALPWDSKELAALTAYTAEQQKNLQAGQMRSQGMRAEELLRAQGHMPTQDRLRPPSVLRRPWTGTPRRTLRRPGHVS